MDESSLKRRAAELWQQAYQHHMMQDFQRAVELYTESIQTYATAEAYTFRGWAYQAMGRIDDAIEECKQAIAVDPDFGNPYNDIGAYLMEKGNLDDAISWLQRAKEAPRYDPRHFPYMNLGRLYAAKGMISRAIEELEGALRIQPHDPTCRGMLVRLRATLN